MSKSDKVSKWSSEMEKKVFREGIPLDVAKVMLSQRIYASTQDSLAKRILVVDDIPNMAEPRYETSVVERVVYVDGCKTGINPFAAYKIKSGGGFQELMVPLYPMLPDDVGKYARKVEAGRFFPEKDTGKSTTEALTDWCVLEEKMLFDLFGACVRKPAKPAKIGAGPSRDFAKVGEWINHVCWGFKEDKDGEGLESGCVLVNPDDLDAVSECPGFIVHGSCIPKGCKFDRLGRDHTWMGMTAGILGTADVFAAKSCPRGRIYLLAQHDYLGAMPMRNKLPDGAFCLFPRLETMMEWGMAILFGDKVRAADIV